MSAATILTRLRAFNPLDRRRYFSGLYYRGDYRLRLLGARWQWHGLNDRRWHVSFERGPANGDAVHHSFTIAVALAVLRTYAAAFRRSGK